MSDDLCTAVENLVRKAPEGWLTATCETLRALPASATLDLVRQRLPGTNNADLAYRMDRVLDLASTQMSWEALSWSLRTTDAADRSWQADEEIELLWSGPTPANQIPARRIDQALYDLIGEAQRDVPPAANPGIAVQSSPNLEIARSDLTLTPHNLSVRLSLRRVRPRFNPNSTHPPSDTP
ncbi:hypothetical protein [Thiocapsa sp.]|uniref:hypothetical protein n=1 Tax=Thiocapsa sp. TaxID=2024551 RepID=UPI0026280502|nr:hypothetical protein [Thiocapsa sp.]